MSISFIIDLFLHLDRYLNLVFSQYNIAAYFLLFLIIFMETGFVVTPFLPGDSIIFATAALAATGEAVSIPITLLLFYVAAVGGDTVNYHFGYMLRQKVQRREKIRFVKMEYIDRTQAFFERHGGMTITIARFIPIIRTFAPFVAGVGSMRYKRFLKYNIAGGISWVTFFFVIGYFFGNIPFVKNHFSLVVIAIIFISVVPIAVTFINSKLKKSAAE
jgi:membrane-associated protein